MKIIKYILLLILCSLNLYSNGLNERETIEIDSSLIESFIANDCLEMDCPCIRTSWEIKILQNYGITFFHNFDKIEYENKSIRYIYDDLSNKYKFLGYEIFNGFEKHKPDDKFRRSSFVFYFKLNDTSLLSLYGCINIQNVKKIKNQKESFNFILNQNQFVMNFTKYNVTKYLNYIRDDEMIEFERVDNLGWKLIKKHFHYLFPKVKRKKGN